MVVIKTVF